MVSFDQLEPPQRRAVLAFDRNYAVTAGAGSGKTTTFAARYVRLLEETDADPQSIAAITFTESGARELQERVRETVSDRLQESAGETYQDWGGHHDDLPEAYIHTIHGFCARLLREYALQADVPIGFDVIEETAARGQQLTTVERFVEQHLDDERIELLTQIYYRDRLETLLTDLLREHHQARRWADRWADATPEDYLEFVLDRFGVIDTATAREALTDETVREALADIQRVSTEESAGGNRITIANNVADAVEAYSFDPAAMDQVQTHDAVAALCEALTSDGTPYFGAFDSWAYTGHDDWDSENAQRFEEATNTLVSALAVEEWATADRLGVDRNAGRYYVTLASIVQDLHADYQQRKARETALDFADLIDSAIQLLRSNSTVREELRKKFEYVMLDEVQDTDPRQWELVDLLTSTEEPYDEGNVFVVGDEKQSIFRFRGADVTQFAVERERLSAANDTEALPSLEAVQPVEGDGGLDRNFRSLPAVLEPINDLFEELFGAVPEAYQNAPTGIDSEDRSFEPAPQRLNTARTDAAGLSTGASFVVTPSGRDERQEILPAGHSLASIEDDPIAVDAHALAAEVSALLDGHQQRYVTVEFEDGVPVEEPTTLDPSDVAILLRKRTHLKEYERALAARNIPYTVASGIGFYSSTEVIALRNLFRVLGNPRDDLALFSVLRSPLFGLEDGRVVELWNDADYRSIGESEGELWAALASSDAQVLTDVRDRLQAWREAAGMSDGTGRGDSETEPSPEIVDTWDRLLGKIIEDTGYLASLATDERGQQAIANVEKFRSRLRGWSEDGVQTLSGVIDRIEQEIELSTREGEAEVPADANGVRIMTIHDAKGREFPAVFVPGLSHDFNLQVGYGDQIAEFETLTTQTDEPSDEPGHASEPSLLGIRGPGVADPFTQEDTVLKRRLRFSRRREAIAEEKRILYVAMTRARDHLCLLGTTTTDDGTLETIDTGDASDPSNWFDLIGPTILDEETVETFASEQEATYRDTSDYPLRVRLPDSGTELSRDAGTTAPELTKEVPSYDPDRDYSIPASALGSLIEDEAPGELQVDHTGRYLSYSPPTTGKDHQSGDAGSANPTRLPGTVFGTALHKAVELGYDSEDSARLQRLAEQCAIQGEAEVEAVTSAELERLSSHLESANEYLASIGSAHSFDEREVHASLRNGEVYGDIDRLVVEGEGYHIIDYKTNALTTEAEIDAKAAHYAWQLRAYAVALYQTDPDRAVEATLVFTEQGVTRSYEWTPIELSELAAELDFEICRSVSNVL
jgi:ATP-dependent helicase/nuclease subunit A